jgi:hypothetical protein
LTGHGSLAPLNDTSSLAHSPPPPPPPPPYPLAGTGIPVASVATGFPSGQIKTEHKLAEIEQCVADGAREIDIVLSRDLCLRGEWQAVYDEVKLFKQACGPGVDMKTILATGELATFKNVYVPKRAVHPNIAGRRGGEGACATSPGAIERTCAPPPCGQSCSPCVPPPHPSSALLGTRLPWCA